MIIDKYNKRARKINSLLCIGLDSDFEKIPKRFKRKNSPAGGPQFEFNKWIIEETHEYAAAYKPNSAFYEARGDQGIREPKMTIEYLHKNHPDIFTILDAKRADIGNTNQGYVTAIFDWLGFDAVTINPYLGQEAIQPFLDRKDKCSIILCRTSNDGAGEFQDLNVEHNVEHSVFNKSVFNKLVKHRLFDKVPLWQIVAERVSKMWNKNKNCMLVVGATQKGKMAKEMKKIRNIVGDITLLVPGVGAQGGSVKEIIKAGLNKKGKNKNLGLIINSSRGIIFSKNPKEEARKLCEEIRKYKKLF